MVTVMKLSNAYKSSKCFYSMVYNTGHTNNDDLEVEFVDEIFFNTKRQCLEWFEKTHSKSKFIKPRCVKVYGFNYLTLAKA